VTHLSILAFIGSAICILTPTAGHPFRDFTPNHHSKPRGFEKDRTGFLQEMASSVATIRKSRDLISMLKFQSGFNFFTAMGFDLLQPLFSALHQQVI